jgi:hypothetical protein
VGVVVGVSEQLCEAFREPVRDGVLQLLGFLVHLLPRIAQLIQQKRLDQAVATHQPQGLGESFFGERGAMVALVLD